MVAEVKYALLSVEGTPAKMDAEESGFSDAESIDVGHPMAQTGLASKKNIIAALAAVVLLVGFATLIVEKDVLLPANTAPSDKLANARAGSVMKAFQKIEKRKIINQAAENRSLLHGTGICLWTNDGECDVPQYCDAGTDDADCADTECHSSWRNDGYCDIPQYCLSNDDADCGSSSGGDASGGWETQVLNKHNEYRQRHGSPSLSWSTSLASKANGCLSRNWYRDGEWHLEHCNSGENIAGYFGSPVSGVQNWYNEIEHTRRRRGKCDSFSMHEGHYTQVVWKSSTRLGCAKSANILICNYDPPGNMMGAFSRNVPAL